MPMDIEDLTYEQLIKLNRKIVERLKFLDSMQAHNEMMQFNMGDKVTFESHNREKQTGILIKFNKKTIAILTDDGQHWNVAPHLLFKVKKERSQTKKSKHSKVVNLHGNQ